jgi:uncharacterized membrane protein HdeD (DUF308 family)
METIRYKNWWFLSLNGFGLSLIGVLILFFTQEFIKSLLIYIGIGMLIGGIILLLAAINNLRRDRAGMMILAESIIALAIGIALIFFPETSVALFLIMTGIWAMIIGIIQLVLVVNLRGELVNKNYFLINGLLTIALGAAMLFNPFQWAVFLVKLTGALALFSGLALLWFSLAVRNRKRTPVS